MTEPTETSDLLALAAASDLVAAVVGWIDLEDAAPADRLAALAEQPGGGYLRGIRHPVLIEPDPDWLRRPAVHRGIAAVGSAGLCYDLVVPAEVLPAATDAARACPDVLFVLDHGGNPDVSGSPDPDWARSVRELASLPNTTCKLSGFLSEAPLSRLTGYFDTLLDSFGPDRLMFGSDWPVSTLGAPYADVVAAAEALTAGLSPAERAAILAGTARRTYRLGTTAG